MKPAHKEFLKMIDINMTELATLRGVSRQYATRDMTNFLSSSIELKKFVQVLQVIDTERSNKILAALVNNKLIPNEKPTEFDPWEIYIKLVQLKKIEVLMQK